MHTEAEKKVKHADKLHAKGGAAAHKNIVKEKHDEEISELNQQIAQLQDRLLRSQAEQENLRKRLAREVEQSINYANTKFANDLLEVMENFHRAMDSFPKEQLQESEVMKNLFTGIEMIKKSLDDAFEKHNITRIFPIGEKFNHEFHQAITQQPSAEHESGTILQVIQAGYKLNDRLLRPALVVIAQ